jgi:hypothetical protein
VQLDLEVPPAPVQLEQVEQQVIKVQRDQVVGQLVLQVLADYLAQQEQLA